MPWIASQVFEASSGTLAASVQAGDVVVVMALQWASTTPTPSLASGYTSLFTSTSTYRRIVGYRTIASSASSVTVGTWSGAETLYVGVYRGVTVGVASSTASNSNAAGPPALALTAPGQSIVAIMGSRENAAPTLPSGMVERYRDTSVNALFADTDTAVSSFPGTSGNFEAVAAIELTPTVTEIASVLPISWKIESAVTATLPISWSVKQLSVTATLPVSWKLQSAVTATLPISWTVISRSNWQNNIRSTAFRKALTSPIRVVTSRAELVDYSGNPLTWTASDGTALDLRLGGASVSLDGSISESWKMNATAIGTEWVPFTPGHPLHPQSQVAIRLWWGLLVDGGEIELPVGTFAIGDIVVNDNGVPEISITGRDMLSIPKGAGYDGQTLNLGGMTIDAALIRLFGFLSPNIPVRCEATSITLPSVYEVGSGKPNEDWDKIAATAGWIVRTDRMGAIVIGPAGGRGIDIVRNLQEGEDCTISSFKRNVKNTWYNRVCVITSSSEIDPPLYYVAQDDDPGSPTWVGLGVVRSMPMVKSDTATTVEACKAQAELLLRQNLRPQEELSWVQPPDPTYDYLDVVQVARAQAGVGGIKYVEKWSFALPVAGTAPGTMSVTAVAEGMM